MTELKMMVLKQEAATPEEVRRIAASIAMEARNDAEREIIRRLLYDPRMKPVWRELLKEKRDGGYLHPVQGCVLSTHGPVQQQERACGKVFNLAFCAGRDRLSVCKWPEVEAERAGLEQEAAVFRRAADELARAGTRSPEANADAPAMLRMAQVKEEQARRAVGGMPPRDDPLVIENERGDRIIRATQIVIAEGLPPRFA